MHILVIGGSGTIGRPLVAELIRRGHDVWQCDAGHQSGPKRVRADVANFRQLGRVFKAAEYDVVFHLAAEFGRLNGEEYYDTMWQTNVVGTRNVLEWQREKGFNLIFASSSEIYGETDAPVLYEDLPTERPVFPQNDYAISKWANELQIMHMERRYRLPVMRLRFFNAYGPEEYYHPYRSVVCLFCYRALHDLPYEVYRGYYRAFMYIGDFIPTLANCADRFRAGEVYNIGGEEYRSVEELSNIVLRHLGKDDRQVEYLPEERHNVVSKRPDITKAKRDLGHNPTTPLEIGVPKTIEWMRVVYGLGRTQVFPQESRMA